MKQLLAYDQYLFKIVNNYWSNSFFDFLMPWLRNANTWIPVFVIIFLLVTIKYRKTGLWWIAFCVSTVLICDFVTGNILKHNIVRLRPCNDPALADWVHVLVKRPVTYSFASSHASVSFGTATFFYQTLKEKFNKWPAFFFFCAFSISFAQVYVGVHYPIDIICGAIIGIVIGYLSGKSFNKQYGLV